MDHVSNRIPMRDSYRRHSNICKCDQNYRKRATYSDHRQFSAIKSHPEHCPVEVELLTNGQADVQIMGFS